MPWVSRDFTGHLYLKGRERFAVLLCNLDGGSQDEVLFIGRQDFKEIILKDDFETAALLRFDLEELSQGESHRVESRPEIRTRCPAP